MNASPRYKLLRRVNPRTQTPILATILILAVGVVLMVALPGSALLQLIIASSTLPALIYGAVTVLYLSVRKRLERKEGGFSLGRFEVPVTVGAIVWVVIALFALVSPGSSLVPDLVVVGLILTGALYFAKMLIFNRDVLEHEPGEDSPAAAVSTLEGAANVDN